MRDGVRWYIAAVMSTSAYLGLAALFALIPAAASAWRTGARRDYLFWLMVAVAVAGPLALVAARFGSTWRSGLSETLWVTILASVLLFSALARINREAWRLSALLFPYLLLIGVVATFGDLVPDAAGGAEIRDGWILFHVVIAVVTYGLLTLAAIAGLAVLLRERAMKNKRRDLLSDLLPSITDSENLQVRLLIASEVVLGFGVATGMGLQVLSSGSLLAFDHKTLLTVGGFLTIGGLLIAHFRTGLRGRHAARILLVAYLLITLGFPGVKFVRDILLV